MKIKDLTDEQLKKKESRLRDILPLLDTRSPAYAQKYYQWFALREVGLSRGIFQSFIPPSERKRRIV